MTEGALRGGTLNRRSSLRCCGLVGLVAWLLVAAVAAAAAVPVPIPVPHGAPPHLEKQGTAMRLIVKGRPMLVLGGELGNSSASSATYMAPHWLRLKQLHLGAVLTPVTWELIEPVEGRFDWSSVDALLKAARANDLKLVLLWFGAWKNSMSTYVPAWVKRDQTRFPRAQLPSGQGLDILSAFAPSTRDADARAFAALLGHLKSVDGGENTVLMIQVENEVGMLPVAREYGAAAERLFHEGVPEELVRRLAAVGAAPGVALGGLTAGGPALVGAAAPGVASGGLAAGGPAAVGSAADGPVASSSIGEGHTLLRDWQERGARKQGDWSALFGEGDVSAEAFTAWYYARYVEAIVEAGKAVYPLPMYVNAALNRMGKAPGEYPSGGPLPHLLDVWKAGAPALDLIAPDIYFNQFNDLATRYKRADNPLFIPEANNADRAEVPANVFYAFGKLDAIGCAPFSIESVDDKQPSPLSDAYAVLTQLSPAILEAQGTGRMSGFRPRVLEDGTVIDTPVTETIGAYRFTVSFIDPWTAKSAQNTATHGGIIIQTGAEDYLVAGQGMTVTFAPVGDGPPLAGIDNVWEGTFDARGAWVPGRLLNGDQTHQGRHLRLAPGVFQIQRVRLYRYR
jgi:beta-galactosidase GanA